ncbi:RNA-directed DNA polymerase, eukaryota, reverse transcriptase zinc-binding domain protein [Tanacetum coccineum]|uniref:RNA-directed DNA polymerase, eukaryota, reverse transcriptase zinc-binding domain protein n=1 Tax=Tanacetum coccineum TaxID=301880 RepID=A0ABQ4Z8W7_9ASTR
MSSCPNISAITLERYLSDHRPILLRERHFDYEPTPFRFFHYWFEMNSFDKLVKDTWNEAPVEESNAMTNMMKKLKHLKQKIREWNKDKKKSARNRKIRFKEELAYLDATIDKGKGNAEVVKQRIGVIKLLQGLENLQLLETAQKSKIKWAIEGDENSKYYHGILNKKRSQLTIRAELELEVSKEEIKRAVWDCGTDKSPGPDGFTCLRSSRGSIIVNGSPTEEFQFYKGLKQGDPLSPFLFILIMESLHISFQRVVDAGMFKRITLGPSLQLSHMFYADDAVFVGQWSDANFETIVHVLECFFRASGMRINMSKSKLMGISVEEDKVKLATSKIGCLILKPPFSYLVSKVGGLMSRIQSWNEVVDRVTAQLSKWKMKTLSIGGRLTLLKSVLGSMPIYHMSIFKVPMSVLHRLESIRCQFFNGHDLNSKKTSWVKWKNVLASKEKGGLGVSSLYALNRGLMFKWVWRFFTQNTSLWAKVIKAIHGDDGKVGKNAKSSFPSIWLDIVHEMELLKKRDIDIVNCIKIKLGNGDNTTFWEDVWHGDTAFKNLYPRMYALESCKVVDVATKLAYSSLDSSFRRVPRGGVEQEQYIEVATKTRWVKVVPIKVNVHAWKVRLDSLPMRFNISRRERFSVRYLVGGMLATWKYPLMKTG